MAKRAKSKESPKTKVEIEFHYLKTHNYRSFYVDGVFGGITPRGKIYMELFLERAVTPQRAFYEITKSGLLGKEIRREGKAGLIREIEGGAIMDLATAERVRDWLDEKIKTLKTQNSRTSKK